MRSIQFTGSRRGYGTTKRSRRRKFIEQLEPRLLLASGNSPPVIATPISDLTLEAGVPFAFDLRPTGAVVFGFEVGGTDVVATDNYFGSGVIFYESWQDVTFTGNTVFNENPYRVAQISDSPIGGALDEYTWDNNTYIADAARPFLIAGGTRTWDQWLTQTGFDVSSTLSDSISGTHVSVLPNEYEPGRGHAVVYNWDRLDYVDLDLSTVVEVGATFEIYNVLGLKGAPVLSGVYAGGTVSLPMTDVTSPIPIGHAPVAPLVVDKEFGSFLIVSDASPVATTGNEFFVSTVGTPQGDGSLVDPWDLQTAMSHPDVVSPGDTIWVLGGTYVGDFTSVLSGTEADPIVVREWPGDEVVIDLNNGSPLRSEVITIEGRHTYYQGFEVFSSDLSSRTTKLGGSWPDDINRGNINIYGDHVKLINWEIHDLNKGLGYWSRADGGEVYGSLIYNNGWSGSDRAHGQGIYTQNEDFTRRFADNILFNQFRHGIKVYGSSAASLKNYVLEGNISFNNGASGSEGFSGAWQYLIGGGAPAENIEVDNNFAYVSRRPIRDPDAGDRVTYSARQSSGQPLPTWLEFYGDEGYFVGTPSPSAAGTIEIELTATDIDGESVTEVFQLTVEPVNQAPTVIADVEDQLMRRDEGIHIDASIAFDDPEDRPLTYSLAPQAGGVIPSWISIDANSGIISGTAVELGTIALEVFAIDDSGNFSSEVFSLTVNNEILVDLFPLNPFESKLDGQWQGSIVASDGKVYFASSTHAHNAAGLLFQYNPSTGEVRQIGPNVSAILGEDPLTQVPQGKLHSPIVEANGWLYTSTFVGNYWDEALNGYTGAHLFGYELGSTESGTPNFVDFGIPIPRYSTYSAVAISPDELYLWSIASPWAAADAAASGAHLFRTEIATGTMQDFGQLTPDINAIQGAFAIHVDSRGDAWVTMIGGADRLFVGRAASSTIDVFAGALPAMTSADDPDDLSAYQDGSWWRWGQSIDDERFLFTIYDSGAPSSERSGGSLWEFDASKSTDGDLSDAFREVAWIGGSHLGMTYSNGTVYFVRRNDGSHDPKINAVQGNGEYWNPNSDTGERLHLYSIRVDDPQGVITDWGRITDADGRVPWRIESLSANTNTGEVYLTGDWVMLDTDPDEWRTLRHDGGTSTTYTLHIRGQAFSVASVTVPSGSNLAIQANDSADPVTVGDSLTYNFTVNNFGPELATNVVVTDVLPAGASFESASASCSDAGSVVTCSFGDIDPYDSVDFAITVLTTQIGALINTASVTSDTEDAFPVNNTVTETTVVNPVLADLVVTVNDVLDPVVVGEDITYQLTVTNDGPKPAMNVSLTNAVPPGVVISSISVPCVDDGNAITCDLGDLAPDASADIELVFTTTQDGQIVNTATVTSDTQDPDLSSNTSSETTVVSPLQADLVVTISDNADPVVEGDHVTYTITVANLGPSTGENILVTHSLASTAVFVATSSPSCSHDNGEITCSVNSLPSGDSIDFQVEVATTIPDLMSSVATVTSDTLDPDLGNNSAAETTQVEPILADLAVVLSDVEDRVGLGADITYQLAVTNNGPQPATGVVMTQTLPEGVLFVSATPPCTSAGGIVTCDLGAMNPGDVIDLSVVVTSTESGRLFSTASIVSDTTDPDVSDNSVTERTTVLGPAGPTDVVFVSFSSKGRIGDVPYADEDILAFDTTSGQWSLYFDGSQVGLGGSNVNAFHVEADGSILMSFAGNTTVSGLDLIQDSDIVRFVPTAHGALTAGSFEWFFDGPDVGLNATTGDIDAISFTTDGRLVISGPSSLSLPGLTIGDEDLLVLNNGVFGAETSGEWELYFDGSDIGLAGEHVWGSSLDGATGDVYLTTYNNFSAGGISGDGADILLCDPTTLGDETVCDLSLWLDGSSQGIESGDSLDGIQIGSFTGNEVYGQEVIYMSTASNVTVGGLAFRDEDIFIQDTRTGAWRMFFDASDLGITTDVDGFHVLDDGSVLMSFNATTTAVGAGTVSPPDIVRFLPTSTGEETAGTFEMYFDGSDVGLTGYYEDVDVVAFAPDGGLLVSTTGSFAVSGISGRDEDLLKFNGTSFGTDTAGIWELYFDASDVELTASTEDINGVSVSPVTGQIHYTTLGSVSAGGVSGSGADILTCTPGTLGDDTTCTMDLTYAGTNNGIIQTLNGIHIFLPNELTGADVSVATNDLVDPATVGDEVTFRVTVTNDGPQPATNVVLTDVLPANTTFVSASPPCVESAGTVTCDLGQLDAGESVVLDFVVDTTQPGPLSNTASVSSDTADPTTGNNSDTETTDVNPVLADLEVTLTDNVDPVTVGDNVVYQITVTNHGPQPALDVVLTDTIPANVQFVASPNCIEASGTVTCNVGDLAPGAVVSRSIEVTTLAAGPLTNSASASSITTDPNADDNTSVETTDVNPPQADLALVITDSADPVTVGENVVYHLVITNNGPEPATNVVLANTLPADALFVSATPPCVEASGIVTCNLGNMAVGAEVSIDIEVTTTQAGQLSNLATVNSDTTDAVGSNNSVTESTEVLPVQADLVLTLSDAVDPVTAGDNITYNVTVTNNGPETATDVELANTLPASVSLVSPTGSCVDVGGVVTCELGDLASGAAASFDIVVVTSEAGSVSIVANVTSGTFDSDTSNNSVTETTTVLAQPGSSEIIYVSFSTNGKVGDIPYSDEDILAFNTTTGEWLLYFDGSQVGLASSDLDAFHVQADGSILMSFDANKSITGLGLVRDSDILKFTPTGHGILTAGSFDWFLDGSDVGLSPTSGDVDAIGFTPDGRLVISLPGNLNVAGFTAADEDLLVLDNGAFGADSSGDWSLYFDGSDVGLANGDVWGTSIDSATGDVHLTTQNGFSVSGVSGDGADIITCGLGSIGDDTTCSFTQAFDGGNNGVASGHSLDGIQIGSFTGTELFGQELIYLSPASNVTISGFAIADEDVVYHDTQTGAWHRFFDGSDVGINTDVDAFTLLDDGSLLMSFNASTAISGLGTILPPDIVRFIPTLTGDDTVGSFEIFFDASDVGLTTYYEDVDAIGMAADGNLLLSTKGGYSVDGLSGTDADLLKFIDTSFGPDTDGSWELYFDGSDVELTSSSEDVGGVSINPQSGEIHFTTLGTVNAGGLTGAGADVLTCTPGTLGDDTDCALSMLYDGSTNGLTQSLNAIHIDHGQQALRPAGITRARSETVAESKVSHPSSIWQAVIGQADSALPFQNRDEPLDVSNDGIVSAGDALRVINELAVRRFSLRETSRVVDSLSLERWPDVYFDTSGDDRVTAMDALLIINKLGTGESSAFIEPEQVQQVYASAIDGDDPNVSHDLAYPLTLEPSLAALAVRSRPIAHEATRWTPPKPDSSAHARSDSPLSADDVDEVLSDKNDWSQICAGGSPDK